MAKQGLHDGVRDAGVFEEGDGAVGQAVEGERVPGSAGGASDAAGVMGLRFAQASRGEQVRQLVTQARDASVLHWRRQPYGKGLSQRKLISSIPDRQQGG